jgi:outer membrane protein OmpA-like peptidoglycan-associated protein
MQTNTKRKPLLLATALLALLVALPAAADGEKTKIKGLITHVQGNTVTIKDANNTEQTITLSPTTKYKKTKGLTGAMSDKVEQTALMPGLPITAEGVHSGSGFEASEISFKSEDFRTAQQVEAGTDRTRARMEDFGTYEALATAEVLFDTGSTSISAKGKSDLMALAAKSKDTKDFRMVVQGFTDSVGDPAANQRLSTKRAWAVTNFLQQQGGVSPGRVQAGDGMGIAADAGSGSNANARKVVVKLVVDKGVHGGN